MYEYKAKITEIYDGDTLTAELDLGFELKFTQKLRLFGLNAPEVRGKERPEGLKSRDYLRERILGKEVIIKTEKDRKGKYGRYLATIFLSELHPDQQVVINTNINQELITKNYAKHKEY